MGDLHGVSPFHEMGSRFLKHEKVSAIKEKRRTNRQTNMDYDNDDYNTYCPPIGHDINYNK